MHNQNTTELPPIIRRSYNVEQIDYSPGRYRVVEIKDGLRGATLTSGLEWMQAQALCGHLDRAISCFIEDNYERLGAVQTDYTV